VSDWRRFSYNGRVSRLTVETELTDIPINLDGLLSLIHRATARLIHTHRSPLAKPSSPLLTAR
jgi:hypothetical protein